jgi:hypothetical protein
MNIYISINIIEYLNKIVKPGVGHTLTRDVCLDVNLAFTGFDQPENTG